MVIDENGNNEINKIERVLLCVQFPVHDDWPPLSNRVLASYIVENTPEGMFDVEVIDFNGQNSVYHIVSEIKKYNPDILGISCYIWNYLSSLQLVDKVHEEMPHTAIVLGGPQLCLDNEDYEILFKEHPAINAVINGEGEKAFLNWLLQPKEKRPMGNVIIDGEPLTDIEKINLSPYECFPPEKNKYAKYCVELSRGCVRNCNFCFGAARNKKSVKHYSTDKIKRDLEFVISQDAKLITWLTSAINRNKQELYEFVEMLESYGISQSIEHVFSIDYLVLSENDLELLGKINCSCDIGLQSLSLDVSRLSNRPLNLEKMEWAIKKLSDKGIKYSVDIMLGLPGETLESFKRTFDYAYNLGVKLSIMPFSVLPGSDFYKRRKELGLIYDPKTFVIKKTSTMSKDDIKKAISYVLKHEQKICDFSPDADENLVNKTIKGTKGDRIDHEDDTNFKPKPVIDRDLLKNVLASAMAFLGRMDVKVESVKGLKWGDEHALEFTVSIDSETKFILIFFSPESEKNVSKKQNGLKLR